MKNVLVFPCGSEIGLELNRSLRRSTHFRLYGGSSVDDHGRFAYENHISAIPSVYDTTFIGGLNRVVGQYSIDMIFPAHDDVILRLAEQREAGGLGCELIAPDLFTCRICRSKKVTYDYFHGWLECPRQYAMEELDDGMFPLFLKPDIGQGSKGTLLAKDLESARYAHSKTRNCLILEYLPGREFTVDCFTDRHGELRYISGRMRKRILNGISVNSIGVESDEFKRIASIINRRLHLRGAWFFQVKENASAGFSLMEIAPRIGGTTGFQRGRNVNLPLLTLYDRMGMDVEIIPNPTRIEMDRALYNVFRLDLDYGTAYFDLDDTLIRGDKVDPQVVRFVFQCLNRGVTVILLTRHRDDLDATLAKYRLAGVFDHVIKVGDGESKSRYIVPDKAILVDDSFAERAEAVKRLGLPVFDPSALETLLEDTG